MSGLKIIEGAKQAVEFATGDQPASRLTINGHAYVPEISVNPDLRHVSELLMSIQRRTAPGGRNMDQIVKDMDLANDLARTALRVLRDHS